MAFTPLRRDSGQSRNFLTESNTVITKDMALDVSAAGYVQPATAATTEGKIVATQDITTWAGVHTTINCLLNYGGCIEYTALMNKTPVQADILVKYDLADANTVNGNFSTNSVFLVTEIADAANNLVLGHFVLKDA